MKVPAKLREQLSMYIKAGYEVTRIEPRKGSHWLVIFDRLGPMVVTTNLGDPRAIKNNISELRRRDRQMIESVQASSSKSTSSSLHIH